MDLRGFETRAGMRAGSGDTDSGIRVVNQFDDLLVGLFSRVFTYCLCYHPAHRGIRVQVGFGQGVKVLTFRQ